MKIHWFITSLSVFLGRVQACQKGVRSGGSDGAIGDSGSVSNGGQRGERSGDDDDRIGCDGGENGSGGDCMGDRRSKLTTALKGFSRPFSRS